MKKKLSAIVTNFNYGKYISRCLDSLLNQTIPFHQIIVVDDGSSDNSRDVLDAYSKKILAIYKENGGPLSCYFAAFDKLETDYFYTLDADDWAYPTLVEKVLPTLAAEPAKVQFQLKGVSALGDQGTVFPPFPEKYDQERILEDNISIGFYISPPTSGNVFSKRLVSSISLEQWGKNTNIDGTPALVMPYLGEIVTIREPLVNYFIHTKNLSGVGTASATSIQRQINSFIERWENIRTFPEISLPPFPRQPSFLAERYLLLKVKKGQRFFFKEIFTFVRSLLITNYAPKEKSMLCCWALSLGFPVKRFQNYLADIRLNGTRRPKWLRSRAT